MEKSELVAQTKNAFDFIQKLYMEVSYLIKEVGGLLGEEEERFIIGRPSGYGINTRFSTGLDPNNVRFWLCRHMAVFFVPEDATSLKGGQTFTEISSATKVIYLRVIVDGHDQHEPKLIAGILYDFEKRSAIEKFEVIMGHIEYRQGLIFQNISNLEYSDTKFHFRGHLFEVPLYDLHSSEDLLSKVVKPALALFRERDAAVDGFPAAVETLAGG